MSNFDRLKKAIERNKSVTESAVAALTNVADRIRTAGTNEKALAELADALEADSSNLAAAIVKNTVAEEEGAGLGELASSVETNADALSGAVSNATSSPDSSPSPSPVSTPDAGASEPTTAPLSEPERA